MSTTSESPVAIDPSSGATRPQVRVGSWVPVVVVLLVAAVVRLVDISRASYWHDEVFTVDLVRLPFGRMFHGISSTEATPPVYYVVAWLWSRLFGTTEAGLRSLSALASWLSVVPVYIAGRLLFCSRVGVAAAALAATSPLLVWYGQEARSYALGIFAVSLSFAAVAFARRQRLSPGSVAFWAAASIVAIATHYFAVFAIAAEGLWLLWLSRKGGRRLVIAGCAAVAVVVTVLIPLVLTQRGNPSWIASSSLLHRMLEVPSELLAGPQPSVALFAVPVLALSLGALAILFCGERTALRRAGATLGAGAAVVLVPLALVVVGVDFFVARNVVFAVPFLFVGVAAGVGSSRLGLVIGGAIVALNLYVVATTAGQPKYGREDWRSAATALGVQQTSRVVVLSPSEGSNVFRYYQPRDQVLRAANAHVDEVDIVGLPPANHGIGRNPVPPRPVGIPKLAGFHLERRIIGTDYTILRLRARLPTTVTARQLLQLSLGRSAALLIERSH